MFNQTEIRFIYQQNIARLAVALAIGCALAVLPNSIRAQETKIVTKSVQFAKGKTSTVIKSTAQAYTNYAYTARAKANQHLNVSLTSPNKNVYFTVFAPGGLDAMTGDEEVTIFNERLEKTGVYKIMVFSKSDAGASSYALKISVN